MHDYSLLYIMNIEEETHTFHTFQWLIMLNRDFALSIQRNICIYSNQSIQSIFVFSQEHIVGWGSSFQHP
jgi:hypothetical protein